MYELIQVSERSYYIQCPAKIGVVKTGERENEVCLIDSGNDKDAGKKVKKILDAQGWTLSSIYNTHSHADHIGGNRYLQAQTGCKIYAPGIERDFTEHPILEPSYLYGGNPPKELRHKFLMAQESNVLPLSKDVLPAGWDIIPLPGHSFDMVGFRAADNVIYLADCISSEETLAKYQITFLVDVEQYLKTLEDIMEMKGVCFIPAHADVTSDIIPLAKANIGKVLEIADKIIGICESACSFEQILKRIFEDYALSMSFEQHALVGSTVRSYLTWLHEKGKVQPRVEDNMLLWEKV